MLRLISFIGIVIVCAFFASSEPELRPLEIIILSSGETTTSINFFNSGEDADFTAKLAHGHAILKNENVNVKGDSYGSFFLSVSQEISEGIYMDTLTISKDGVPSFQVPVAIGVESVSRLRSYDALIKIYPYDVFFIDGDLILSPEFSLYKLNFDPPLSDEVLFKVLIYSLDGVVLKSSQEIISVSQQASFKRSYNLGQVDEDEILVAVLVQNSGYSGVDLQPVNLKNAQGLSLSPVVSYNMYSLIMYFSIIALILAFCALTIMNMLRIIKYRRLNFEKKGAK